MSQINPNWTKIIETEGSQPYQPDFDSITGWSAHGCGTYVQCEKRVDAYRVAAALNSAYLLGTYNHYQLSQARTREMIPIYQYQPVGDKDMDGCSDEYSKRMQADMDERKARSDASPAFRRVFNTLKDVQETLEAWGTPGVMTFSKAAAKSMAETLNKLKG